MLLFGAKSMQVGINMCLLFGPHVVWIFQHNPTFRGPTCRYNISHVFMKYFSMIVSEKRWLDHRKTFVRISRKCLSTECKGEVPNAHVLSIQLTRLVLLKSWVFWFYLITGALQYWQSLLGWGKYGLRHWQVPSGYIVSRTYHYRSLTHFLLGLSTYRLITTVSAPSQHAMVFTL